jgi:hypothetical protein
LWDTSAGEGIPALFLRDIFAATTIATAVIDDGGNGILTHEGRMSGQREFGSPADLGFTARIVWPYV